MFKKRSPRSLGKWSNLMSMFCWNGLVQPPTRRDFPCNWSHLVKVAWFVDLTWRNDLDWISDFCLSGCLLYCVLAVLRTLVRAGPLWTAEVTNIWTLLSWDSEGFTPPNVTQKWMITEKKMKTLCVCYTILYVYMGARCTFLVPPPRGFDRTGPCDWRPLPTI